MRKLAAALLLVACRPASDAPATKTPAAPTTPSSQVETKGFSLSVPEGWQSSTIGNGLGLESPDHTMIVQLSGGYPAADLPALKRLVDQGAQAGKQHDWETRTIAGRAWDTAAWAGGGSRLAAYFLTDNGATVLVTVDARGPVHAGNDADAQAILASLKVRGLVVEGRLQDPCPASARDAFTAHASVCLEPAVIGPDVARACGESLLANGAVRDPDAAAAIGAQTGKSLECYRAPR
jgi:hypothetical protein